MNPEAALRGVWGVFRDTFPHAAYRLHPMGRLPDRRLLHRHILPYFLREHDVRRVLDVGIDWYTLPNQSLFAGRELWTLEPNPGRRRYSRGTHIEGRVKDLPKHAPGDYFDLVILNGIFNSQYMSDRAETEDSFDACFRCIRPGGFLLFGWNDTDDERPYPITEIDGLHRFERFTFPPADSSEVRARTDRRHVFTFLRRPGAQAT